MPKVLIASSDPTIKNWETLPSKIKTITTELNTIKNGVFTVEVVNVYVKPQVKDGRITHEWFNTFSYPLYRKGYDFVVFHMGNAQRTQWAIQPTLRGVSQRDTDFVGEMYVWADENTKRNAYNQFVETTLHELRHELCRGMGIKDDTHTLHDKHGTIKGQFSRFDMEKYLPIRRDLLQTKLNLLQTIFTLLKKDLQPLVRRNANAVIEEMKLLNMPVRIVEGYRSIERQNELYAQGRTKEGLIVTNAKGGESYHNYGVAVDFVFVKNGYNAPMSHWQTLGTIVKQHGFTWGGDWSTFRDLPHAEMTFTYTLKDFQTGKVDYNKYK